MEFKFSADEAFMSCNVGTSIVSSGVCSIEIVGDEVIKFQAFACSATEGHWALIRGPTGAILIVLSLAHMESWGRQRRV